MADTVGSVGTSVPQEKGRTRNSVMAVSVISAHGLEHMYGRGFLFLLTTRIYEVLGLSDFQVSMLDGARTLYSGVVSMGSGFMVDVLQDRRGQILAFSMAMIGVGYFLVAVSPSFGAMLAALALAAAGTALWHPSALGLLAQRFPQHSGLFISMHRSTGNAGDWIGPLLIGGVPLLFGGLLAVMDWRWVLGGGTPMVLVLALVIFVLLRNVGGSTTGARGGNRIKAQWGSLKDAMGGGGLRSIMPIFAVSALRGMGDRPLLWMIPLYLAQELGKSDAFVGVHVALLAAPGIISGPLFGSLSDRIGRKPIVVLVMASGVVLPVAMVLGGAGILMTAAVALFGLFMFSVNSLTQAAAIDVVEGKGLEGTFIGLMWGSNAFFGFGSNLAAGLMAVSLGRESVFYFAAGLFFLGLIGALVMPGARRGRTVEV